MVCVIRHIRIDAAVIGRPVELLVVVDQHAVEENGLIRWLHKFISVKSGSLKHDVVALPLPRFPHRVNQRWPLAIDGARLAIRISGGSIRV